MRERGRVYVVVLNWNRWKDTIECINSVLKLTYLDRVLVVCDNGSDDTSVSMIEYALGTALGPGAIRVFTATQVLSGTRVDGAAVAIIVKNEANLGFAGGNNVGVRLAIADSQCRFVWLLNNDTVVEPDALGHLLHRMASDSSIGICGSSLVYADDRKTIQALGGGRFFPLSGRSVHIGAFLSVSDIPTDAQSIEDQLSYVIGASMLVRREYIEQVGYMREDYFLYFEEIDWALRGVSRFRLGYSPRSIVYHKEGASIGTSSSGGSPLSMYYLFRNRLRFSRRFYPWFLPTVVLSSLWEVIKHFLRGRAPQAKAALDGMLAMNRSGKR